MHQPTPPRAQSPSGTGSSQPSSSGRDTPAPPSTISRGSTYGEDEDQLPLMPEDQDLYPPHRPRSRSSSGEDTHREEAWAMWQRECQHEPWYQAWEKMTSDNEKERLAHRWRRT